MKKNKIPIEILKKAIAIIKKQKIVPQSPGKYINNSSISYCAGAAIAVAGLQNYGFKSELIGFNKEIKKKSESKIILKVFMMLGWDKEIASCAIGFNDNCNDKLRKPLVIDYLTKLCK